MEVATPRHLQPVARIPCTATPKSGPKPLLPMLFRRRGRAASVGAASAAMRRDEPLPAYGLLPPVDPDAPDAWLNRQLFEPGVDPEPCGAV